MTELVLFQFNADSYYSDEIKDYPYEECERLAKEDTTNITKFNGHPTDVETWLNDNVLDTDNCFYRAFHIEPKFW